VLLTAQTIRMARETMAAEYGIKLNEDGDAVDEDVGDFDSDSDLESYDHMEAIEGGGTEVIVGGVRTVQVTEDSDDSEDVKASALAPRTDAKSRIGADVSEAQSIIDQAVQREKTKAEKLEKKVKKERLVFVQPF
jgi:hypothetical protein